MIRRSARKPAVTMSLFPFLAVLVCTMGALIVLLVIVLHKARSDAEQVAAPSPDPADTEQLAALEQELEDVRWRQSELERQRTEYQQNLSRERLALSHLEDHIRELEEQWRTLQGQAEQLLQADNSAVAKQTDQSERLAELQAQLAAEKSRLEETERELQGKERAYAIIPYDGPNGTRRRPIYIECTDEGIFLQPEGVRLIPADFQGSLGPGNPLDAALRTTREYLARYAPSSAKQEPYPLLIVRPTGAVAYAVARSAMKSWDDEFGYELVDEDLQLAYPRPDPNLKQQLEKAIADARQRQAILASMMPGRFRAGGATALVATTNGGFQVVGAGAPGGRSAAWAGSPDPGSASGDGGDAGALGFAETFRDQMRDDRDNSVTLAGAGFPGGGSSLPGVTGSATPRAGSLGAGRPPGVMGGGGLAGNGNTPGSTSWGGPGTAGSNFQGPGANGPGSSGGIAATSAGGGGGGGNSAGGGANSAPPGGTMSGGSSAEAAGGAPTAMMSGTPAMPGMPGANSATPVDPTSATALKNETRSNDPTAGGRGSKGSAGKGKMAARYRGPNWGLPNQGPQTTGIQRAMSWQVFPDRLVLLPERGDSRSPVVIPLPGDTAGGVDPLVQAVWKRIEQWGIAGDACYWRPILRVEVHPDAEQRFAELTQLLQGSGLVLERRT